MTSKVIEKAVEIAGSQKKLAIKCGVSQPTIWKWLHGKKKVSPENVNPLIQATGGQIQGYEIRPDLPDLFPHPEPGISLTKPNTQI